MYEPGRSSAAMLGFDRSRGHVVVAFSGLWHPFCNASNQNGAIMTAAAALPRPRVDHSARTPVPRGPLGLRRLTQPKGATPAAWGGVGRIGNAIHYSGLLQTTFLHHGDDYDGAVRRRGRSGRRNDGATGCRRAPARRVGERNLFWCRTSCTAYKRTCAGHDPVNTPKSTIVDF